MASTNALLLCCIAVCALSLTVNAQQRVIIIDDEQERLFGVSLEENIQKLKDVADTAVSAALETIKNGVNDVDDFLSKLAAEHGPQIAKKILDFGKGLIGLKKNLEDKNVKTNICLVDEAISKLDTLPNDVGRQLQICKKTVATQINEYIEKTYKHFKAASAEVAELAKDAVKCLKSLSLVCIGKVSISVGAAIFRVPNQVTKQASDTLQLLNSFQERGALCLSKAIDRTAKKASKYVEQVEQCLRERHIIA